MKIDFKNHFLINIKITEIILFQIYLLIIFMSISRGDHWSSETFPNPLVDFNSCGRKGNLSYVCDPSNYLSVDAVNFIDDVIQNISSPSLSDYNSDGEITNQYNFN